MQVADGTAGQRKHDGDQPLQSFFLGQTGIHQDMAVK